MRDGQLILALVFLLLALALFSAHQNHSAVQLVCEREGSVNANY